MKKIIIVLLVLSFALVFTSCGSSAKVTKKKAEKKDIELIPQTANLIAEANISDFLKIEKLKTYLDKELKKNMPKEVAISLDDLKHVTFFSKIEDPKGLKTKPNFGFLLRGNNLTEDLLKKLLKDSEELKHNGNNIFKTKDASGLSLVKNVLVGGTLENTKKVLDLSKNKGKAVDKKVFQETFKSLNMSSAKMAMIVTPKFKESLVLALQKLPLPIGGLNVTLEKLEVIAMGSTVTDTHIKFKIMLKSDKDAVVALSASLTALIRMLASKADELESKAKGAKESFESIKFGAEGNYFVSSITVPISLINDIK